MLKGPRAGDFLGGVLQWLSLVEETLKEGLLKQCMGVPGARLSAGPASGWPPELNDVILSSHLEFPARTTSWVIGFRNSLLPIDLGLQDGGLSVCRLLPWITSLRLAMDLEHPDLDDCFLDVKIAASCLRVFGLWTSDCSDLHWSDLFRANHTVGISLSLYLCNVTEQYSGLATDLKV